MYVMLAVFPLLIILAVLVFYYTWRRRTYCPDGTKHQWKFETWRSWYFRPDPGFHLMAPAHHTAVVYSYTCAKCGRKRRRDKAYFGGYYRPTKEDWEL